MTGKTTHPQISKKVIEEIIESLHSIKGWGSVEIFVQDHKITQVTEKNICKKNNIALHDNV